jgi:hypothetical protein
MMASRWSIQSPASALSSPPLLIVFVSFIKDKLSAGPSAAYGVKPYREFCAGEFRAPPAPRQRRSDPNWPPVPLSEFQLIKALEESAYDADYRFSR